MQEWQKLEVETAKEIDGTVVPASGGLPGRPGDAVSADLLVECKDQAPRNQILIKGDVVEKILDEARRYDKLGVLKIRIKGRQVAVLDWEDFLEILVTVREAGEK